MTLRDLLISLLLLLSYDSNAAESIVWTSQLDNEETGVHLYFFWSRNCPHCRNALTFIDKLTRDYTWIEVHSAEISQNRENQIRFVEMAQVLGYEPTSVPTFMICGQMITGYDRPQGVGQKILALALSCRQSPAAAVAITADGDALLLPFLGTIDPQGNSLLAASVLIAIRSPDP